MPTYLCADETGRITEEFALSSEPLANAHFGDIVQVGDRHLTKLPTFPGMLVEPDWAHVAYQLEEDDPDLPHRCPRTNAGMFLNKREILDYEAKRAARPDRHNDMRYDFGSFRR